MTEQLVQRIKACQHCEPHLTSGANPVFQFNEKAKILIAGQAPGRQAHASGIPFDDPSGIRLRDWLGMTERDFYNPHLVAILPMAFCYPGRGNSGDLPPRPECQVLWRSLLLNHLTQLELTIVIGTYAQAYHLPNSSLSLTEQIKQTNNSSNHLFLLPHPSPRNNPWLTKNPWFEKQLLPKLKQAVLKAIN